MEKVMLLQAFSGFFMCGLIWFIQLVHYPAYRFVNKSNFADFEKFHTNRISLIVVPIMLLEFLTALALVFNEASLMTMSILALLTVIWFVTFAYSLPCHRILKKAKIDATINKLIRTNWLRTFAWTLKSGFLFFWSSIKCL